MRFEVTAELFDAFAILTLALLFHHLLLDDVMALLYRAFVILLGHFGELETRSKHI